MPSAVLVPFGVKFTGAVRRSYTCVRCPMSMFGTRHTPPPLPLLSTYQSAPQMYPPPSKPRTSGVTLELPFPWRWIMYAQTSRTVHGTPKVPQQVSQCSASWTTRTVMSSSHTELTHYTKPFDYQLKGFDRPWTDFNLATPDPYLASALARRADTSKFVAQESTPATCRHWRSYRRQRNPVLMGSQWSSHSAGGGNFTLKLRERCTQSRLIKGKSMVQLEEPRTAEIGLAEDPSQRGHGP